MKKVALAVAVAAVFAVTGCGSPESEASQEIADDAPVEDESAGESVDSDVVEHDDGGETVAFGTTVVYDDGVEATVDLEKIVLDENKEVCGTTDAYCNVALLKVHLKNGQSTGSLTTDRDARSYILLDYVDSYGDDQQAKPMLGEHPEMWTLLGLEGDPNETEPSTKLRVGEEWEHYFGYALEDMEDPSENGITAGLFTGDGTVSGWDKGNTQWVAK